MRTFHIILLLALLTPTVADAGTRCTTRKSGSVTVTNCSSQGGRSTECRSYNSGSVVRTSCR